MSRRNRDKDKFRKLAESARATRQQEQQPAAPALNLDYLNAATVVARDTKLIQIILVGCGGIGAYMAQHIGRIMRVLYDDKRGVNFTLVDPDIVEEKNLGRQLFCEAEIGQPKAVALARRYGGAWGLNTMAFVGEFTDNLLVGAELTILVGCVDNAAARKVLHETLQHNPERPNRKLLPRVWWLDCGNLKDTGRVMLGSAHSPREMAGAITGKQCISLPSPALQYPSLLIPQREEIEGTEMSCAEMAAANLQSLNINAAIAVQASDFLTRLLITNDLRRYQCAVNMASGSSKSFYVTPEMLAREIESMPQFVTSEQTGPTTREMAGRVIVDQLIEDARELQEV